MGNLGPDARDPFIEASDFGGMTPLQNAIRELPLFKDAREHAAATPVGERKPDPDGPPICARCRREPKEIPDLIAEAEVEDMSPEEYAKDDGTYFEQHNMFLCDPCYIVLNMPSSILVLDYMESAL